MHPNYIIFSILLITRVFCVASVLRRLLWTRKSTLVILKIVRNSGITRRLKDIVELFYLEPAIQRLILWYETGVTADLMLQDQ